MAGSGFKLEAIGSDVFGKITAWLGRGHCVCAELWLRGSSQLAVGAAWMDGGIHGGIV